jgi:hypothetical protein
VAEQVERERAGDLLLDLLASSERLDQRVAHGRLESVGEDVGGLGVSADGVEALADGAADERAVDGAARGESVQLHDAVHLSDGAAPRLLGRVEARLHAGGDGEAQRPAFEIALAIALDAAVAIAESRHHEGSSHAGHELLERLGAARVEPGLVEAGHGAGAVVEAGLPSEALALLAAVERHADVASGAEELVGDRAVHHLLLRAGGELLSGEALLVLTRSHAQVAVDDVEAEHQVFERRALGAEVELELVADGLVEGAAHELRARARDRDGRLGRAPGDVVGADVQLDARLHAAGPMHGPGAVGRVRHEPLVVADAVRGLFRRDLCGHRNVCRRHGRVGRGCRQRRLATSEREDNEVVQVSHEKEHPHHRCQACDEIVTGRRNALDNCLRRARPRNGGR